MSAMDLEEASDLWIAGKKDRRLKPRTIEANYEYLARLKEFFGNPKLTDIHEGSYLAYEEWRKATAGASRTNHELNALSQMMKRAGLWEKIRYNYAPIKEKEWTKPMTFTTEEEQRIFDFAKDDPNLELFEIVATITRYTSAAGSELRLIQIRNAIDIYGENPRLNITADTTKNDIRPRMIPLVPEAAVAVQRALRRAARLGSHFPEHYLFPLRVNRKVYDPSKPASRSWLKKQCAIMRERTGIAHVRPHAFRHLIVTEMLENGVPPQTVKAVCGWVSEKMIETYSHTRLEAKKDAILATIAKKPVQTSSQDGRLFLVSGNKN